MRNLSIRRLPQVTELSSALKDHGFGYDVTGGIDMNFAENDAPFASVPFDLAERKYDDLLRTLPSNIELDVSDKGLTLTLKPVS